MDFDEREKKLFDLAKEKLVSPSHDTQHSLNVISYCVELQKRYGGDLKIIIPAAILHDLSRASKERGKEHSEVSAELATPLLKQCGYSDEEIKKINDVIIQHDDNYRSLSSQDAKILKDADKLDGFGARGIARIFMHCGEMNEPIDKAIMMLKERMPKRIEDLNFGYGKKISKRKYKFVKKFIKDLES